MTKTPPTAIWFSTPNIWLLEIVAASSVKHIVLDIEHGLFDLGSVDPFILTAKALGLTVRAKTLAPEMSPIQQMLDLGADSVIIPHIGGIEHAREICSYTKYAPLGNRSAAGGRTVGYGVGDENHYDRQNGLTRCYPMIETAEAPADVEAILALDCVDGVFIGPTDLSLSVGRGNYGFTDADKADIRHIAEAANKAGKAWILPAWREGEQLLSAELGAKFMVVVEEQAIYADGLALALNAVPKEMAA
ncbi:MAG: hypothetical protein JKY57_01415 [Kordiimonadaceae bacterium]|nr:hypothetical protein [Kordiimonadaceae bacterium]